MLSSCSPSSVSCVYSTAMLVYSLEQSNPPSHPQTIVQGSMAREHEHRADQVPQTCWWEAVSVPTFYWWHLSSIHAGFGQCQVALPGRRVSRCNNARELSVHSAENTTPAKAAPLFSSSNSWRPAWSTFTILVFQFPTTEPKSPSPCFCLRIVPYATLQVVNPVVDVWKYINVCYPFRSGQSLM